MPRDSDRVTKCLSVIFFWLLSLSLSLSLSLPLLRSERARDRNQTTRRMGLTPSGQEQRLLWVGFNPPGVQPRPAFRARQVLHWA